MPTHPQHSCKLLSSLLTLTLVFFPSRFLFCALFNYASMIVSRTTNDKATSVLLVSFVVFFCKQWHCSKHDIYRIHSNNCMDWNLPLHNVLGVGMDVMWWMSVLPWGSSAGFRKKNTMKVYQILNIACIHMQWVNHTNWAQRIAQSTYQLSASSTK